MFNLLKKTKAAIQTAIRQPSDINEVIEKIHHDFDSAGERLLKDAKEILSREHDINKGERLQKVGFKQSRSAIDAATIISMKESSKELSTTIEYYNIHYPNYKFITEYEVERICKKYGLICGNAEYYIGDVPEKNIKEIESFSLLECDSIKVIYRWYDKKSGHPIFAKTGDSIWGYMKMGRWGWVFTEVKNEAKTHHFEKPEFKICASVKDFNTKEMRIEGGYKLERNIPDPIVLQPVKGGYLIVTKWGLPEDANKELLNEKMN